MANIEINLQAQQQQFVAALQQATKHVNTLVAQLNTLTQAQQQSIAASQRQAQATLQAARAHQQNAAAVRTSSQAAKEHDSILAKTLLTYFALFQIARKVADTLGSTFTAAITNIDDFQKATIGTAAAITNIASQSANAGKTWDELFHQNLKATKQTFIELEKLAARYFASSTDLQLAYNAFAQRGIVIRRTELEQLAQLTDMILLLTQGQQSSIQVQEEIRSLVNGTIRPTAQLAQLLKSYGKDVKEVAAEIRATQSLKPLEGILHGAQAATGEIQKTFQAAKNGFETTLRQIGRIGFDDMFKNVVSIVERFTAFLSSQKANVAAVFAVIGQTVSTTLGAIEKVAENLFKIEGTQSKTFRGWVTFIAASQTGVEFMLTSIQVFLSVLRDLPGVLQDIAERIDITFTTNDKIRTMKEELKGAVDNARVAKQISDELNRRPDARQDQKDAALNNFFTAQAEVSRATKALEASQAPLTTLFKTAKEMLTGLPWSQGVKDFAKTVDDVTDKIQKDLAPALNFDIRKRFNANQAALQGAADRAVAAAIGTDKPEVTTKIERKFTPSPDDLTKAKHLTDALTAAQDRYNRAVRTRDAVAVAAETDVALQGLRRTLALIEQGFLATKDQIQGLYSVAREVANFIAVHVDDFAFGNLRTSFEGLTQSVRETQAAITGGILKNLDEQLEAARKGLEEFKLKAQEAAQSLLQTEVNPEQQKAAELRRQAEESFENRVKSADELLDRSWEEVQAAKASGDARRLAAAELGHEQEQYLHRQAIQMAGEERVYRINEAIKHEKIAQANHNRIIAQMDAQISEQAKRLGAEELRILQAQNAEVGKLLQNNARLAEATQRRLVAERAKQPRTDLQSSGEEILQTRTQFSVELGQAQGALQAIEDRLRTLGTAATQADVELLVLEKERVASLQSSQNAVLAQMRTNRDFATSWTAVGNAMQRSLDTVVDSILGAFEGKKTNFVSAFKGIADSLVKDSMKDVFQSLTTSLQKGFSSVVKDIAPNMAATLGPAFLAGFGLIASFVLGQLMGNQSNTSTAGNPTVGIQSTEQVRGLIGGETQIPIGLIGESLQDALVPTNMWLARIAAGVERLGSVGGLSPGQVESIITQSINDALQIQPV